MYSHTYIIIMKCLFKTVDSKTKNQPHKTSPLWSILFEREHVNKIPSYLLLPENHLKILKWFIYFVAYFNTPFMLQMVVFISSFTNAWCSWTYLFFFLNDDIMNGYVMNFGNRSNIYWLKSVERYQVSVRSVFTTLNWQSIQQNLKYFCMPTLLYLIIN